MARRVTRFLSLVCLLFLICSCGNDYKDIPLDEVDATLQKRADIIIRDFLELVPSNRLGTFQKKGYVTPMVHTGISAPYGIYSQAPYQLQDELGDNISLKLVKVLDKKLVYSFSYEVESSKVNDGSKKLMFDINKDYGLAKIHFFVRNSGKFKTDKEWVNLFSDDIFLRK